MSKNQLSLNELCSALKVSRRAVQGYESHDLVAPSGRNKMGHLLYDAAAIERIRLIKDYQDFGFTLREIEGLLTASNGLLKEELEKKRLQLLSHRTQLEQTLQKINERISALEHSAADRDANTI